MIPDHQPAELSPEEDQAQAQGFEDVRLEDGSPAPAGPSIDELVTRDRARFDAVLDRAAQAGP